MKQNGGNINLLSFIIFYLNKFKFKLKSYLSNRKLHATINGTHSSVYDLMFGLPQGSCLGPIMFTQYASTIFSIIRDMDLHD